MALVSLLIAGCVAGIGPRAIKKEQFNYNEQVVKSANQQMLLNLVRLRYNDTPLFLELGTVVAQYSLEGRVGGGGNVQLTPKQIDPQADGLNFNGGATWSERPTVTFTPLQGAQFTTQLLSPIPNDTLVLLSQTGWGIDRLMQVCVQFINDVGNAGSATGPTPPEPPRFQQINELAMRLRRLQKSGLWAISHNQQRVPILWFREPADPDNPLVEDIAVARRMLQLPEGTNEFPVSAFPYKRKVGEIGLRCRTLLGVMFYLSQGVEAPPEHAKKGLVGVTKLPDGEPFDWNQVLGNMLRVRSGPEKPGDAFVSVPYRGHWFWIADTDRESKTTFNLLNLLFWLQSASSQGKSPLLTLPVGGP